MLLFDTTLLPVEKCWGVHFGEEVRDVKTIEKLSGMQEA